MSEKELYKVTATSVVYFLSSATNSGFLDKDAKKYFQEDLESNGVTSCEHYEVELLQSLKDVAEDWRNAIPWGNGEDKELTIQEWFKNRELPSCNGKVVEIDGKKYKLTEVK